MTIRLKKTVFTLGRLTRRWYSSYGRRSSTGPRRVQGQSGVSCGGQEIVETNASVEDSTNQVTYAIDSLGAIVCRVDVDAERSMAHGQKRGESWQAIVRGPDGKEVTKTFPKKVLQAD